MSSLTIASSSSSPSRVCRRWSDLSSDLLASIFCKLSSVDLITGVSSVCSSWRVAIRNPHCWRIVDLSDWDSFTASLHVPVSINQVFHRVFKFSGGVACIEEVYLPVVADWGDLVFIADRIPNLLYLSFPSLPGYDKQDSAALANFKSLKGLEVDPLLMTRDKTFPQLVTHLTDLSELKLLVCPEYIDIHLSITTTICANFPKLRKLEMPFFSINRKAILMLLDSLEHLEYLDISGYDCSGITKEILEKAKRLKVFIWHSSRDLGEFEECSNCDEAGSNCQCAILGRVMEWLTDT